MQDRLRRRSFIRFAIGALLLAGLTTIDEHVPGPVCPPADSGCHFGRVTSLQYSPDGQILAVGTSGSPLATGEVRLYEVATGRFRAALQTDGPFADRDNVLALAFSNDGKTLASSSDDGSVALWDPNTGRRKSVIRCKPITSQILALCYAPDGESLAVSGVAPEVAVFDPADGKTRAILPSSRFGSELIAYSPDGAVFVVAGQSDDPSVILYGASTFARRGILQATGYKHALAFSPDGKMLATNSTRATPDAERHGVALWDIATGSMQVILEGKIEPAIALAFSPDRATLFVATRGQDLLAWDIANSRLRTSVSFAASGFLIRRIAVSPDGRQLVVAGLKNSWFGFIEWLVIDSAGIHISGENRGLR